MRGLVKNMVSMAEQLDDYLAKIKRLVPNRAERTIITKAGADVLQKKLADETKRLHYSNRIATRNDPHLADSVLVSSKNIDGDVDWTATVGWVKKKAVIARWLNDGTVYIVGDHFVEKTREETRSDILKSEYIKWKELGH